MSAITLTAVAVAILQVLMPSCSGLEDIEAIYCQESGMFLAGLQIGCLILLLTLIAFFGFRRVFVKHR